MNMFINFAVFQAGWMASVIGAANGLPWIGPLAVAGAMWLHLHNAARPQLEVMLIAACGLTGIVFDSLLVVQGWVTYPSGMFSQYFAPYWIVGMWLLFATTLNVSLAWLKGRWVLASIMGAIFGPASYVAGERLGGVALVDAQAALITLGAGWALIMPGLMALADRLDGMTAPSAARVRIR
jgi:hypothetical protein